MLIWWIVQICRWPSRAEMTKVKSAKFILAAYYLSCMLHCWWDFMTQLMWVWVTNPHIAASNPTTQTNPSEVRNELKDHLQWQAYHFFQIKFLVKFKEIYITIWMTCHMFFWQENGRSSNQLQNRERSSKQHPSDTANWAIAQLVAAPVVVATHPPGPRFNILLTTC